MSQRQRAAISEFLMTRTSVCVDAVVGLEDDEALARDGGPGGRERGREPRGVEARRNALDQ